MVGLNVKLRVFPILENVIQTTISNNFASAGSTIPRSC